MQNIWPSELEVGFRKCSQRFNVDAMIEGDQ